MVIALISAIVFLLVIFIGPMLVTMVLLVAGFFFVFYIIYVGLTTKPEEALDPLDAHDEVNGPESRL